MFYPAPDSLSSFSSTFWKGSAPYIGFLSNIYYQAPTFLCISSQFVFFRSSFSKAGSLKLKLPKPTRGLWHKEPVVRMTGAGLHLGATSFKEGWVGALSQERVFPVVASLSIASCSEQFRPRSFLEGRLHSVAPEPQMGWFWCLQSQHSRPMCNVPSHQFGLYRCYSNLCTVPWRVEEPMT